MWMTTMDAAKRLGVSTRWIRWLARMGELPHEMTEAGQRIFRRSEIERAVLKRRDLLARSRPMVLRLRAVRLRMLKVQPPKVKAAPRQLVFGRRLQIVRSERSDPQAEVKRPRSFNENRGADTTYSVNRRAGGRR
jgi:excisionase family DNA binding protein